MSLGVLNLFFSNGGKAHQWEQSTLAGVEIFLLARLKANGAMYLWRKKMIETIEEGTEPNYVSLYECATLEQAGHIWNSVIKSDGGHCPVCDRWGKLYKRGITAAMARQLIWLCLQNPREDGWVDVQRTAPDWMLRSPQLGTLRHWNMVVPAPVSGTKSRSAGMWKIGRAHV